MIANGPVQAGRRPRRRIGGLLWQRDFRLFWTGETVSQIGTVVTTVAMPLIAVTQLHVGAFVVGILQAAVWLPWLVIGLPAGAWVDRLPRRPVMLICDLVPMVLLTSVPIAAWYRVLTVAQLLIVAMLTGAASVFSTTAKQIFLPTVVGNDEDLAEANAKTLGSEAAANIAGPGVAGVLTQVFGAVTGLLADAFSFAVSGACLLALRVGEKRGTGAEQPPNLLREIRAGIRFAVGDPYLRPLTMYAAANNFGFGALQAVIVVFLINTVGISSAAVGGLLALGGVGGVIGAVIATPIADRLGTARAMLLSEACAMPFALLIPLTTRGPGSMLLVAGLLITDMGITASNVVVGSFRQRYVPRGMLGRTTTSSRLLSYGAVPLGALLGGSLASLLGNRTGVWIVCLIYVISVGILFTGPIRRHRDFPHQQPD
jgi:predicted MFS family arabinose efflux permease